jgi:uncharacterized membrane-anchored protein
MQGLLANKYDITMSNMNNEKVEEYNDGILVSRAARGNMAEKKRQISDQEDGNNLKVAKRQTTTEETEQDVKQIICNCANNHIRTYN